MEPTAAERTLSAQRLPGIDALKALGCVLIVWHHLAFYGPMSDVVHTAAPGLVNWLYDYGRMAVQIFLVVGGFLATASLAPQGRSVIREPLPLILRRYRRLALPLMVAEAAEFGASETPVLPTARALPLVLRTIGEAPGMLNVIPPTL